MTLETRALVRSGDLQAAIGLLTAATASGISPKLRSYTEVLRAVCEQHDLGVALGLQEQMSAAGLELGEEQLVRLACLAASHGDAAAVAAQLDRLRDAHAALSPASLAALQHSLDKPTAGQPARLSTVGPDGVCSNCGVTLQHVPLRADLREQLCHKLRDAARDAAAAVPGSEVDDLERFGEWVMAQRFRYIIDGPNVAYNQQNFDGGAFSFEQVRGPMRELVHVHEHTHEHDYAHEHVHEHVCRHEHVHGCGLRRRDEVRGRSVHDHAQRVPSTDGRACVHERSSR